MTTNTKETSAPDKAVVLLSGGMDSAVCLAIARQRGFSCHALSFDYGQRHRIELEAAKNVAESLGVADHAVIAFDLRRWGGSALTSNDIEVPQAGGKSPPVTYVPARNLIFLSFAASWAESIEARDVFIGVNSLDYSGYPDCRPKFIDAFTACANLGTRAADQGWEYDIHAPLQNMTKADIVRKGLDFGVDFSLTTSCYDPKPDGRPCGRCDSCSLRAKGFDEAKTDDPVIHQ